MVSAVVLTIFLLIVFALMCILIAGDDDKDDR